MSKTNRPASSCPDCDSIVQTDALTRRELIRKASGAALIGAAASAGLFELVVEPTRSMAAEAAAGSVVSSGVASETLVAQLFKSLDEKQKKVLCFPFDH